MKTAKKLLALVLILCMTLSLLPSAGYAAEIIDSGHCGAEGDGTNISWTLDANGVLTFSGKGGMQDFNYGEPRPWDGKTFTKLVFSDDITCIGDYCFSESAISGRLELPEKLERVGWSAFLDCYGLTGKLELPAGLKYINVDAFAYCTGLTGELTIPEGVLSLGDGAFLGCSGLGSKAHIPASVTFIDNYAFSRCSNITDFYFYGNYPAEMIRRIETFPVGATIHVPADATGWTNSSYYNADKGTWDIWALRDFDGNFLPAAFTDVQDSDYFAKPVEWAVDNRITNGTAPTRFSPNSSCTRAQMATFLWRAAGCPKPTAQSCPFTDVDLGSYYADAVLWAYENGIVNGMTATTFRPEGTVTRGQTAAILFRYAKAEAPAGGSPFIDVAADAYYYDAIRWAFENGITTGTSDILFSPDRSCTRAQIVTFLYRYFVEPSHTPVAFEFWTFQALHVEFFERMAALWNEQNPDEQIDLNPTVYDFYGMHTKLAVRLLTGTGAPDFADIEIGKFHNYLQDDINLVPLNDIVEPELDNIVKAKVDIYAKDGNYYGIDYHAGTSVIYYNTELCEKAGIDWKNIDTWDEYYEAGKALKKAFPNKYWTSVETSDIWHMWPQLAQLGGDFTDEAGNITLATPEMKKVLTYNRKLVDEGIAVVAPGTYHHAEEFYCMMDDGNIASMVMPFWYIDRFAYYMPDLEGKIAICALPVWEAGQSRAVAQGGTATSITDQAHHQDLLKRFLSFAKLSADGGKELWQSCGFDPLRTEVWETEEVTHADNLFTDYYVNNPFDALVEVKDEIASFHNNVNLPTALDAMKTYVLYRAYTEENVDIESMLWEEQIKLIH